MTNNTQHHIQLTCEFIGYKANMWIYRIQRYP